MAASAGFQACAVCGMFQARRIDPALRFLMIVTRNSGGNNEIQ
jgi:hypothetical protein